MSESNGKATALALIRERMLTDIELFNDVLDSRDTVIVPRLKLRMAAIVCGIQSPFLDNSLERINIVRHLKEICRRAHTLSYEMLPDIHSKEAVVLLDARFATLLGLLLAECIAACLVFDLVLYSEDRRELRFEPREGQQRLFGSFIRKDVFSSALLVAMREAGVLCETGSGLTVSWRGSIKPVCVRGLPRG